MKRVILVALAGCVGIGLLVAPQARGSVTITFDELGAVSNVFIQSNPLTNQYAGQGVYFSGPTPLDGGAILNELGGFGVDSLSGSNFLAFNTASTMMNGGVPIGPETVQFAFPVSSVSIFGGEEQAVDFNMTAYDALNNVVGSDNEINTPSNYVELAVSGAAITKITLNGTGFNAWVFDNLTYQAVPEPSTLLLVGFGALAMLGAHRRMRK